MTDHDKAFLQPRVLLPFAFVTLIWGTTWLVITGQLGTVPPSWSVTYRFAIGAAAMFVYAKVTASSLAIGRDGHLIAALFGIPQFCFNFNFVYLAEQHVTSGLVAVVFAMLLVPNALFAALFLGHRINGRFIAGSLVALAGVALLFIHEVRASAAGTREVMLGIGLSLLGVLAASVSNVIQASERVRTRALPALIAWGMTYGVIANAAISWILYGPPVISLDVTYLAGLVYLGLFASAIAFSLYFAVIRAVGPGRAAYSSLIIPIIAMTLSTIFEDYVWTALAAAGGMLAMAGLAIALVARRPAAASGQAATDRTTGG